MQYVFGHGCGLKCIKHEGVCLKQALSGGNCFPHGGGSKCTYENGCNRKVLRVSPSKWLYRSTGETIKSRSGVVIQLPIVK